MPEHPKPPVFDNEASSFRGVGASGAIRSGEVRPPRNLPEGDQAWKSGVLLPSRPKPRLAVPESMARPRNSGPVRPQRQPRRPAQPKNPLKRVERILIDEANRGFTT